MRAGRKVADGLSGVWLVLALAGALCSLGGGCARASEVPDSKSAGVGGGLAAAKRGARDAAIRVSFKLDPRLTRGMYMGDRWVSPATFRSVRQGSTVTVDVRAQGVDAAGKSLKISPEWRPENPEMVLVTPSRGSQVRITVLREGQSKLTVDSSGTSIVLLVKATYQGDATRVEISR